MLAEFLKGSTKEHPRKLYILLTSPESGQDPFDGWGDEVTVHEFKERIRFMLGFEKNKEANWPTWWNTWFSERCEIKRISNEKNKYLNHTKAYCIDKKLLYIGSDNCYPSYNEEFGVWVDDTDAIKAWYDKSWVPQWKQAPELADETLSGFMKHTID